MNELADKVDAELVEFEKAVDRLLFTTRIAKTQEYEELASLLIECRREVIKALRFAADMERLVQAGCEPGLETQVDNPDNPGCPSCGRGTGEGGG